MGAVANLFPATSEADWRKAAEAALKGASLETLVSETADGVRIEPVYPPAEGPRAIRPGGPWRIIARLDHPDADEANAQALDDLANGADGLQVVSSGALGAYGFGLRRFDSATLHKAFDGVRFDEGATFELDLGPDGPDQALRFAALIERSGARPEDVPGRVWPRPVRGCGARTVPCRLERSKRSPMSRPRSRCEARVFGGRSWSRTRAPSMRLAGARRRSLPLRSRPQLLCCGSLEEAETPARAKPARSSRSGWRPTRTNWRHCRNSARCASPGRALKKPAASSRARLSVQAESAWRMMTARDPYVNVMRGASAAFSAGLGGADSVSVLPHTLAAGLPDGLARRLARNAQLILLRESNLGFVADPAAGAGAFEAMTQALCDKAWRLFQEIEGQGGLSSALCERRVSTTGRRQRGGARSKRSSPQGADHRRQRARQSRRAGGRGCDWRA